MNINYDVVVIGGGTAGVIAAIQAGRAHAKTLLIEKSEILGGTMTNAGVDFPGLFHAWTQQIVKGIGWELVKKCVEEANLKMPDFSMQGQEGRGHNREQIKINPFIYSALCDEAIIDAGVTPLFHSMVASIENIDDFKKIQICTKRGLKTVTTKVIIDCTGDANAVDIAGYEVYKSKECQPATLICSFSGYDLNNINIDSLQKKYDDEVQKGNLEYTDIGWSKTQFNMGMLNQAGNNANHIHINGIYADSSEGKTSFGIKGRKSILRLYRFLKKQPGFENLTIEYISPECGIRETNRIKGKKTITLDDYISGRLWDDAVCYSFYPIDLHNENKGNGLDKRDLKKGTVPSIPRGAMLPYNSENIIVAGRCVSSDQLANSALRVQASCMAMGQAAGAMGALAALTNTEVSNVPIDSIYTLLEKHEAIFPNK